MTWIAGGLALTLLLFVTLYRMSLREHRNMGNLVLRILLDERVYAQHRQGLADLVRSIDAKRADELHTRVWLSLDGLAKKLEDTALGTAGSLWILKQQ